MSKQKVEPVLTGPLYTCLNQSDFCLYFLSMLPLKSVVHITQLNKSFRELFTTGGGKKSYTLFLGVYFRHRTELADWDTLEIMVQKWPTLVFLKGPMQFPNNVEKICSPLEYALDLIDNHSLKIFQKSMPNLAFANELCERTKAYATREDFKLFFDKYAAYHKKVDDVNITKELLDACSVEEIGGAQKSLPFWILVEQCAMTIERKVLDGSFEWHELVNFAKRSRPKGPIYVWAENLPLNIRKQEIDIGVQSYIKRGWSMFEPEQPSDFQYLDVNSHTYWRIDSYPHLLTQDTERDYPRINGVVDKKFSQLPIYKKLIEDRVAQQPVLIEAFQMKQTKLIAKIDKLEEKLAGCSNSFFGKKNAARLQKKISSLKGEDPVTKFEAFK